MITGYFVLFSYVYFDQCKTKQNKIHAARPLLQIFPLLSVTELLYNLTINSLCGQHTSYTVLNTQKLENTWSDLLQPQH